MLAAAAAVTLAGIIGLLAMTRWGIGTSPDSVHYIKAARHLLGSEAASQGDASLTHFAPLYPFLLALVGLTGVDPLDGARWLNALLFGANIFLVGHILRSSRHAAAWPWLLATVLMALSMPALSVHAVALTEPVFILLGLAGFLLLGKYLENQNVRFLVGSAFVIGIAFLARYAGAAYVMTGCAAVVLLSTAPLGRRVRDAVLFGSVASLPMLAWMLRNLTVTSTATGRDFVFHPVGRAHVWQALYTMSSWMLVPAWAPDVIRIAVGFVLLAAVAVILLRRPNNLTSIPPVVRVLALFILVYAAFLAVSISFFDANTQLDDRILLPVFAAGLIVVFDLFGRAWPGIGRRPALAAAIVVLVAVFTAAHVVRGATGIAGSYNTGWGFTSLAWQRSSTVAAVRSLPEGTPIYSNAPEIIYLHTGRDVDPIPKRWLLMNQQPNRAYPAQLTALKRELETDCGMVVYFHNLAGQKSIASEQELSARLALRRRVVSRDGSILSATACQ